MKFENGHYTHSTLEEGYDHYVKDRWRTEFHFKIASLDLGDKILSEAIEVINNENGREPYIFTVLSALETGVINSEISLKAKILKGINERSLESKNGKLKISDSEKIRGRFEYNNNFYDTAHDNVFVIDGKRITVEKFLDLLEPYTGFSFELKILDPSDAY